MELTASEIADIQISPRCDGYKEILISIANMLSIGNGPVSDDLVKVSLVGNNLELTSKSQKKVNIAISKLPSKIRDLSDLTLMQILSEASGQYLGVKISFDSDHQDLTPTETTTTESCPISYTTQTCDPRGHCWTQTVTETGYRTVVTTTKFKMTDYSLNFVNAQNQIVYSAKISDADFDSKRDEGMCSRR